MKNNRVLISLAIVTVTLYWILVFVLKQWSVDTEVKSKLIDTNYAIDISTEWIIYNTVLNHIKENEGLSLQVYYCPSGYPTIGYGHVLKTCIVQNIDEPTATIMLKDDFMYCIEKVKSYGFMDSDTIFALAHFCFCLGEGRLKTVVEKYRSGNSLSQELLRYVYYTKDSVKIYSSGLLKRREFEVELLKKTK